MVQHRPCRQLSWVQSKHVDRSNTYRGQCCTHAVVAYRCRYLAAEWHAAHAACYKGGPTPQGVWGCTSEG